MTAVKSEHVDQLARKLSELLDREGQANEIHIFTSDEVKQLQRVLRFVERVDALGWWGKWLFYAVVTAGAIIANWERIKMFLFGK